MMKARHKRLLFILLGLTLAVLGGVTIFALNQAPERLHVTDLAEVAYKTILPKRKPVAAARYPLVAEKSSGT